MISYLGNFGEDATVYIMFNTFSSDDPSASCTITNFVNTDVHVHKDDGLTQRNNAAGITVSVDFDGITGSHMVKIDTSDNTVAGFWVVGHEYFVRIEGTTIDGATINSVIGQFSIENRFNEVDVVKWLGTGVSVNVAGKPTVDVTNIGASSQSLIDLKDFVDSGYDPVTNKVQGVVLADTTTTNTDMRGTDSAALAATALTDVTWTDAKAVFLDHSIATVDTNVDSILADTGTDGVLLAATATSAQLVDDVWDEILTGALHNIATSAGRRLRELGAYHISSGTAQAGAAHSITLAADAGAVDHILNRNLIVIQVGTGAGQTRTIVDYNGTSKVAVVDRDWWINPDATSEYSIIPDDTPVVADHGVAQAGSSTTITLRTDASAIDSTYSDLIIFIMAGTGAGQARLIDTYVGSTKVATIHETWTTTPDNTSVYAMIASGKSHVEDITATALAKINTECDTALTDYDPPTRTEATADKDAIITEVNANETKIDALNDITVADIIAGVADGSYDLQEMMRLIFSACCLKVSGGGTATISTRDSADSKDRIVATVTSSGDRTGVVLDGT